MSTNVISFPGKRGFKRSKHPRKAIEQAICMAEELGWRYQPTGRSAHAWGRLYCPLNTTDGCRLSIWSTPRNAENHAKQIVRCVLRCSHIEEVVR